MSRDSLDKDAFPGNFWKDAKVIHSNVEKFPNFQSCSSKAFRSARKLPEAYADQEIV
jgi:hypothetical protein